LIQLNSHQPSKFHPSKLQLDISRHRDHRRDWRICANRDRILKLSCDVVLRLGWSRVTWKQNFTAIHLAALFSSTAWLKALLKLPGASEALLLDDDRGLRPMDYALSLPHIDTDLLALLDPSQATIALPSHDAATLLSNDSLNLDAATGVDKLCSHVVGAPRDVTRQARRVRFDSLLTTIHEITPYSEVYGIHPRKFHFDASMAVDSLITEPASKEPTQGDTFPPTPQPAFAPQTHIDVSTDLESVVALSKLLDALQRQRLGGGRACGTSTDMQPPIPYQTCC